MQTKGVVNEIASHLSLQDRSALTCTAKIINSSLPKFSKEEMFKLKMDNFCKSLESFKEILDKEIINETLITFLAGLYIEEEIEVDEAIEYLTRFDCGYLIGKVLKNAINSLGKSLYGLADSRLHGLKDVDRIDVVSMDLKYVLTYMCKNYKVKTMSVKIMIKDELDILDTAYPGKVPPDWTDIEATLLLLVDLMELTLEHHLHYWIEGIINWTGKE